MAAESAGLEEKSSRSSSKTGSVKTVLTCEGDLSDPTFSLRLHGLLGRLQHILQGSSLELCKLEPWNSVRVTLSIPREAALRLRQLAADGNPQLRALGILSVQVEGDQVISLRIAAGPSTSEPQEIIIRTSQDGGESSSGSSRPNLGDMLLSGLLGGPSQPSSSSSNVQQSQAPVISQEKVQFKSPNVVCPANSVVPQPRPKVTATNTPFPFTSMNQALHSSAFVAPPATKHKNNQQQMPPPPPPPPPYPVTMSSPLLVNLLQNSDSATSSAGARRTPPTVATAVQQQHRLHHQQIVNVNSSANNNISNNNNNNPSPSALNVMVARPPPSASAPPYTQPKTTTMTTPFMPPPPPPPPNKPPAVPPSKVPTLLKQHQPTQQHNSQLTNSAALEVVARRLNNALPQDILDRLSSEQQALDSRARIDQHILDMVNLEHQTMEPHPLDTHQVNPSMLDVQDLEAHQLDQLDLDNLDMDTFRPPPPYPFSEIAARSSSSQSTSSSGWALMDDITPSLPDLKADDLDLILPSLERDLANTSPIRPEDLLNTSPINSPQDHQAASDLSQSLNNSSNSDKRHFLINPLTGELEPHSGGESEVEDIKDVFTGLESPTRLSDEDSGSTIRPDNITTDTSDGETRSMLINDVTNSSSKPRIKNKIRDKSGLQDLSNNVVTNKPEKIKLRLKLEKSEPVSFAYKVDVSYMNAQPKKAVSSPVTTPIMSVVGATPPPDGELRVPPLHISLRGRNHAVISNKKKSKIPGEKAKMRRLQMKKNNSEQANAAAESEIVANIMESLMADPDHLNKPPKSTSGTNSSNNNPLDMVKKVKKLKMNHLPPEYKEPPPMLNLTNSHQSLEEALLLGNTRTLPTGLPTSLPPDPRGDPPPYKERRGSDSDVLLRSISNNNKFPDTNGIMTNTAVEERRRRLSQSMESLDPGEPPTSVPGSTNIGTIAALPQKIRKEKSKNKDGFKSGKDLLRNKNHSTKLSKQVALPTGDVDMEAKFKQRLLEGSGPPHRTEAVHQVSTTTTNNTIITSSNVVVDPTQPTAVLEVDKCNTPERGDGGKVAGREGEDSGIESMDALSEKSPNQVGQSPPSGTDTTSKTQVPDILDIEAQLAKMEGQCLGNDPPPDNNTEAAPPPTTKEQLEPMPVRVTPPLYTYSNPEKGRSDNSPTISDDDENSNTSSSLNGGPPVVKGKSLLEQLLIEIPDTPATSLVSPNTRSLRTRATSKLSSPELLNSPINTVVTTNTTTTVATANVKTNNRTLPNIKRKRQESESSNTSLDETGRGKKTRKVVPLVIPTTITESSGGKNVVNVSGDVIVLNKIQTNNSGSVQQQQQVQVQLKKGGSGGKGQQQDESSDSDEPLMEKLRKSNNLDGGVVNNSAVVTTVRNKSKTVGTTGTLQVNLVNNVVNNKNNTVSTRRSVRSAIPAQNTRSKGDKPTAEQPDTARRKTRSAASEVENMNSNSSKRKKEVK